MNRTLAILAILALATVALAMPRHVILAVPQSTWQDANATKRDKIRTFIKRFRDPTADEAIGITKFTHTPSGQIVFCSFMWTQHLQRYRENISDAKIATIMQQLADNNIRIQPTGDIHAQRAVWNLVRYAAPVSPSNTTTTVISSTTTTTTEAP